MQMLAEEILLPLSVRQDRRIAGLTQISNLFPVFPPFPKKSPRSPQRLSSPDQQKYEGTYHGSIILTEFEIDC